jgi:hypothetical protein
MSSHIFMKLQFYGIIYKEIHLSPLTWGLTVSYEVPYLGPEGDRPGRTTQAVRHTCSGYLGIVKILKLHHISKNPS